MYFDRQQMSAMMPVLPEEQTEVGPPVLTLTLVQNLAPSGMIIAADQVGVVDLK